MVIYEPSGEHTSIRLSTSLTVWFSTPKTCACAWPVQDECNAPLWSLRATRKECWRLDLMTVEAYQRAIDVKSIQGEGPSQAAGRALKEGEKTAILAACRADDSPAGPRDAAIFGLAVYAGLRLENYNGDDQVMRVKGKGNKTRTVPLTGGLADALDEWLALRGKGAGSSSWP